MALTNNNKKISELNSASSVGKDDLLAVVQGDETKKAPRRLITEENYTSQEKQKLAGIEAGANKYVLPKDVVRTKDIEDFIREEILQQYLLQYSKVIETGSKIQLLFDSSTYTFKIQLLDKNDNIISQSLEVDLPLESMVVDGEYNKDNKTIELTLKNGNTIEFSVADLVSGLQSEITLQNKLSSDLVDDTNSNNKFTNNYEKEEWNNKYSKPSTGIPRSDLHQTVQASLGKADTAVQPADLDNLDYNNLQNIPTTHGWDIKGDMTDAFDEIIGNKADSELQAWYQATFLPAMEEKQDKLINGINIKSINNESILGEGNLNIEGSDNVFIATRNVTSKEEIDEAINAGKIILVKYEGGSAPYDWIAYKTYINGTVYGGNQCTSLKVWDYNNGILSYDIIVYGTTWRTLKAYWLQERLSSGTNIKTINNESILGEGNIDITGGDMSNYYTKDETNSLLNGKVNQNQLTTYETIGQTSQYGMKIIDENENDATLWMEETGAVFTENISGYVRHLVDKNYVDNNLSNKQDELISGTNIKTINNQSLLGSGNIDIAGGGSHIFVYNMENPPTIAQLYQAVYEDKVPLYFQLDDGLAPMTYYALSVVSKEDTEAIFNFGYDLVNRSVYYDTSYENGQLIIDGHNEVWWQQKLEDATEDVAGTIKTNPSQGIELDENGKLLVGGRLGQYPNGGLYYPTNIEPISVGAYSFLMSDGAKNLSLNQRSFAIMAGANVTCKSAAAGTTEYRVTNSQSNRFALAAVRDGRAALNQSDAQQNGTAKIMSIKFANGNNLTEPYFGPAESSNDIIITLDRTINPDNSTTSIRVYGTNAATDNILVGQGVGANGGKVISLGQSTYAGGNQNISVGNSTHVTANNSVALGHTHLVNKQYCFAAGQGHDFTNGTNGASAVGIASEITSNTAFAVGNGTFNGNGNLTRSNALEVTKDGALILKSPNGTKYKVSIDDTGSISITAA